MAATPRRRWDTLAGGMLVCAGLALTLVRLATMMAGRGELESRVTGRPIQLAEDGYVSSHACRACHPSEYASWHRSYHRTMTQVATPEAVAARFDNVRVDQVPGRPMLLSRAGNELWAEFDDPDWDGRDHVPPRIRRRMVMTTGSHNQQIYWYATERGRTLGQLPSILLIPEGRWIPRHAAVMRPPGPLYAETGAWNGICISCHATNGKPGFDTPFGSRPIGTQSVESKAAEFGVACEACHGPGGEHAQLNRSLQRRYSLHFAGGADASIVRPTRLDPRRSSQVCGQCHSVWEFNDNASERQANWRGLPFRPGDELGATRFIVQPTKNLESPTMKKFIEEDAGFITDLFWSDGMVRATGREYNALIESPCYRDARDDRRTLSCFSCHAMHQSADDPRPLETWRAGQLSPRGETNEACLQCHEQIQRNVSAHTNHGARSAGSVCYNCHMPYTTYGLLKTIRSHQVSSPSVQAMLGTGRPNACNLCHLDKPLGWTMGYLERWYSLRPVALSDDDRSIAASLVQLLRGDAGQRAIVAQTMGWAPAQRTSGTDWLAPYLALLLTDSYDAVRYIAARSLDSLAGYERLGFDFVSAPDQRLAGRARALQIWRSSRAPGARTGSALLMNADGTFKADIIDRLIRERNNRRVVYRE